MWVTSLLEKLLPALAREVADDSIISESMIKSVQIQLYKNIKLNPESIVRRSNGDLVHQLCTLKIDFGRVLERRLEPALKQAVSQSNELLDSLLSKDSSFHESASLADALQRCLDVNSQYKKTVQRKKSFLKNAVLATTLIPIVAYGVHWTIANQIQPAVIDELSVVYPANSYEYIDGVYQMPDSKLTQALADFGEFYFGAKYRYEHNPLPLAYNRHRADSLGASINDNTELQRAIEAGYIGEKQLAENNFAMFRVFIRNIRDANIVNQIKISGARISENNFPWEKLDVSTTLDASIEQDEFSPEESSLWVTLNGAPVTDVTVSTALTFEDGSVGQESLSQRSVLQHSAAFASDALQQLYWPSEGWTLLYLSADELSKLLENNSPSKNDELFENVYEFEQRLYEQQDISAYMDGKPYIYFPCEDGAGTILIAGSALKQTLNLSSPKSLQVLAQYKLLDGTLKAYENNLELSGSYLLRDGMVNDVAVIERCVGPIANYLGILDGLEQAETGAGAGGWLAALDSLAVSLMDAKKVAQGTVVANKSVLLDFDNEPGAQGQTFDDIYILKDGDFVLLNVFLVNMPGGLYEFSMHFDNEKVAETKIDILWPQSLSFQEADIKYFRNEQ